MVTFFYIDPYSCFDPTKRSIWKIRFLSGLSLGLSHGECSYDALKICKETFCCNYISCYCTIGTSFFSGPGVAVSLDIGSVVYLFNSNLIGMFSCQDSYFLQRLL